MAATKRNRLSPAALEHLETMAALGILSISGSQADVSVCRALYFFLTGDPDSEGGGNRIAHSVRRFRVSCDLLEIAMCSAPSLADIITDVEEEYSDGSKRAVGYAHVVLTAPRSEYFKKFLKGCPRDTCVDYINKVRSLYEKRSDCMHSFRTDFGDGPLRLHKPHGDGKLMPLDPETLMHPCIMERWHEGRTLASAITCVAHELSAAAANLPSVIAASRIASERATRSKLTGRPPHDYAAARRSAAKKEGERRKAAATARRSAK